MLSASEARKTGFSFTAHVRTLCCEFWVILRNKHGFESILEEILLGRGQGNLNFSQTGKKRYNGRDCLKIVGATAESLKRALRLN